MLRLLFLSLFLTVPFLSISADDLANSLQTLKVRLADQKAAIFDIRPGSFYTKTAMRFSLKSNHDYRIFLLAEGSFRDLYLRLDLSDDRSNLPAESGFLGVNCLHWEATTFKKTTASLSLKKASRIQRRYVVVISSQGRKTPEGFVRERVVTTRGDVYQVNQGRVFFNGKSFFSKRDYHIISLCIKPNDDIFLRSDRGDVFRRRTNVYKVTRKNPNIRFKNRKEPVTKLVANNDDRLFMFRKDGAILDERGRLIYRGSKGRKAIDLVEEDNNVVWIIRQDGKRQQP